MAQVKGQRTTPERELSDEEIANLSVGEFKALVIQMLTELIELGLKMEEQMKDTQSEVNKIFRGPTVTGRKPGLTSMVWSRRKKDAFDQNRMKK